MPARRPGYPPLDTLRKLVAEKVESTSVRTVAREIGMSSSGLHSFLYGDTRGAPHPRTHAKLTRWYRGETLTRRSRKASSVTPELAEIAAAVLLQHLNAAQRPEALARLFGLISDISGENEPRWLRQVRPTD